MKFVIGIHINMILQSTADYRHLLKNYSKHLPVLILSVYKGEQY